ncbi:hypothetical protein AVEN_70998-1 [Araneus ventricosus]|uniref:Uncharacterized protein n=1 Tax=Araneus ventricosus TaxID=182803 RepID=A0A4Y2G9G2_ARAVE|nr:hypothetical protein AVEN_70998-1 [Araneus ventricosus]
MTRATPEPEHPSPNFRVTPAGAHFTTKNLTCTRPTYMAVLRWNRDSNLEPSSLDAEILPPCHHGPMGFWKLLPLRIRFVSL